MSLNADRDILRRLAEQQAEIAALPGHRERAAEWTRLNGLNPGRPLLWINEVCWEEMNVDEELTLRCQDQFCREIEWALRTTLYQWRHFPGDMIVEGTFFSPLVLHDTGFGMKEKSDVTRESGFVSRHFHPQFQTLADVGKIRMPEVTFDRPATEENFQRLKGLFGDILRVEQRGVAMQWFAPWDALITWYGVQEALTDLAVQPELVHAVMDRLTKAYLHRLKQYENLNVLAMTHTNMRIGSGGLGYTNELPAPGFDPQHVRTIDQWGCATAQIFSEVSPTMHEEFALHYERRWLEKFGLTYYGCCEPLHFKMDMLRSVRNLRKVSMNYRVDLDAAARHVGTRYVFSYKPNPALLATDTWNPQAVRDDLRRALDKTRGCIVEVILKDISTVRNQPHRLWEWEKVAMEVIGEQP